MGLAHEWAASVYRLSVCRMRAARTNSNTPLGARHIPHIGAPLPRTRCVLSLPCTPLPHSCHILRALFPSLPTNHSGMWPAVVSSSARLPSPRARPPVELVAPHPIAAIQTLRRGFLPGCRSVELLVQGVRRRCGRLSRVARGRLVASPDEEQERVGPRREQLRRPPVLGCAEPPPVDADNLVAYSHTVPPEETRPRATAPTPTLFSSPARKPHA